LILKYKRSAGCIIYEIITFKKAFTGDDINAVFEAIKTKPISILKECKNIEPILKK